MLAGLGLLGFRAYGSGFKLQGFGLTVQGSGFRADGSGFMISWNRDWENGSPTVTVEVSGTLFPISPARMLGIHEQEITSLSRLVRFGAIRTSLQDRTLRGVWLVLRVHGLLFRGLFGCLLLRTARATMVLISGSSAISQGFMRFSKLGSECGEDDHVPKP